VGRLHPQRILLYQRSLEEGIRICNHSVLLSTIWSLFIYFILVFLSFIPKGYVDWGKQKKLATALAVSHYKEVRVVGVRPPLDKSGEE